MLLPYCAPVIDLVDVVYVRHPANHAPPGHGVHYTEVKMDEASMPQPRRIVHLRQETRWCSQLQLQDVQAICSPSDPDEQLPLLIEHTEVSVLDLGLASVLVQLAKGNDVGSQLGDEVVNAACRWCSGT